MSQADDDVLMAAVWADPDCPVELADPDSSDGLGGLIPWPRERVAIPEHQKREEVYRHLCRQHGQDRPDAEWFLVTLVEMRWRIWFEKRPGEPRAARVYLGQCHDCGRIYWAIVRP